VFLSAGHEAGAAGEARRDALSAGDGRPAVSGQPPGQANGGGEALLLRCSSSSGALVQLLLSIHDQ